MAGLDLLIIFAAGYGLAMLQTSPCPAPPPKPIPPAVLMADPPTIYLLPENWRPTLPPASDNERGSLRMPR